MSDWPGQGDGVAWFNGNGVLECIENLVEYYLKYIVVVSLCHVDVHISRTQTVTLFQSEV